jgi:iron complex outermembrane receptor protein
MRNDFRTACLAAAAMCAAPSFAQGVALTEQDFLGELPIVYTVSRLPQPLNEAPGAVTVIDRDLIRRSGARELADLLRLVPGMQVTHARGGNPLATYHGAFFDLAPRMQVLVDGRSVYTVHYSGGTSFGMRSIALEDIERVEVLRGSNAANYGARAFLGVVNIITRDPRDTRGAAAGVAAGERGIDDRYARIGWGGDDAVFRLSANSRSDRGLSGPARDDNRLSNVNFSSQLRLGARDQLELRAGLTDQRIQDGFPDTPRLPEHERGYDSRFLQVDWRRALAAGEEVSVQFSRTEERYSDAWAVPLPAPALAAPYDYGGRGEVTHLGFNHRLAVGAGTRVSWGGEWRDEIDRAPQLFGGQDRIATRYLRAYGNLETRLAPRWLLNAGAMLEHSSQTGHALMPRAMLNWQATPSQALRAGVSMARRAPTAFERHGDQRVFGADGRLADWVWRTRGDAQPERLVVAELGWFGEFRELGLTADARLFQERIQRFLEFVLEPLPAGTEQMGDVRASFVNGRRLRLQGLELQADWRPLADTRLVAAHTVLQLRPGPDMPQLGLSAGLLSVPSNASALTWLQRLPGGFDLGLTYVRSRSVSWAGPGGARPSWDRTDLRLARGFTVGPARGELALVVQNTTDRPIADFDERLQLRRRAFVTLRLEL